MPIGTQMVCPQGVNRDKDDIAAFAKDVLGSAGTIAQVKQKESDEDKGNASKGQDNKPSTQLNAPH